jgi:hypothetical protein
MTVQTEEIPMSTSFQQMNPSTHLAARNKSVPPVTDGHRALIAQMQCALEDLQNTLTEADLPPADCYPHSGHYLSNLRRLKFSHEPASGFYDINYIEGYVEIGTSMLSALELLTSEELACFTQHFLLHETLHVDQGLYSSSWYGVQYASVVLEEMDYFADAWAIAVTIAWRLRVAPEESFERITRNRAFVAVRGLQVFDQIDYPEKMAQIGDARLRRYLIWYTQYERLLATRSYQELLDTLYPRICVEIATLMGTIDSDGVKEITTCPDEAQYFLSLNGVLERQGDMPGFDIASLFNGILAYDDDVVMTQIRYAVMARRSLLLPQL